MKRYPAYQDSGVAWIGEIPAHWCIAPIKHITLINNAVLRENTSPNFAFKYIDIGNVHDNGLINPPKFIKFSEAPSRARRIVDKGDIIISTVRTYLKAISFINENNIIVSTGFATLKPKNKFSARFIFFAISNQKVIDTICRFSVGVSYPAINSSDLGTISLGYPLDLHEQTQIAQYLDHKTHLIDTLIAKKQKQIERLRELRAAIINQAVTQGLNPDVPMKDSGIEWLGDVPAHWEIMRLKYLCKIALSSVDRHTKEHELPVSICHYPDAYYNENINSNTKLANGSCTDKEYENFRLKKNDVIITKDSETPDDIGVPAFVEEDLKRTVCGYHLSLITPKAVNLSGKFLFRFIQSQKVSSYFETQAHGITRFGLGKSSIENLSIPLPTLAEQLQIAMSIDEKTRLIDKQIDAIHIQVKIYQEYRTTLISEAVTGKIDVRAEAAP